MNSKLVFLYLCLLGILPLPMLAAREANTVAIPDDGWRLWPDTKAAWKEDALYLPDEVNLAALPVNAPTGGWQVLDPRQGVVVTLPSTVEQHFWGQFGMRPYTKNEYNFAGQDSDVKNGNYLGVSWWWHDVKAPASFGGKLVLLHVRGARQRAEIYVNGQLVGYDMIAETAFDCDVTKALRAGEVNRIAIRITNPGGWMDWVDHNQTSWGKARFHMSHGFGGLDRGLTLTAHDPVYLEDAWALNTSEVRTITAHATVRNTTDTVESGTAQFEVVDPKSKKVIATSQVPMTLPAHSARVFDTPLTYEKAELWDLDTPRLYKLRVRLLLSEAKVAVDEQERMIGFRWFEPRGLGKSAGLYLNGRRVRLYTAISWGFWGLNGLWPTPELAEKEVRDAKSLNLNMLNFHRNIGKEEVFGKQDELGLLRYMEPGGGEQAVGHLPPSHDNPGSKGVLDTSGTGEGPRDFCERYMEIKICRMIRQFRSHPSLVIYNIQNEWEPDFSNPALFNVLRKMHALDPSRIIVSKSGPGSWLHQAWFAPYAKDPMVDDGSGYSGWRDEHTCGGPGVWQDSLYQGPGKFTHQIDDPKEIVVWGEMLGSGVADNHPQMIQQIKARGGESYDLLDHQLIADAYHAFLDKWGFRNAFPTDDVLFRDLGNKIFEFWGRVIETARLSESNDILTISGWESTAIENHSGLVDNLRNFKGDPALIAPYLAPLLPVLKSRASILAVGAKATVDFYLINETTLPAKGPLRLTLMDPKGKSAEIGSYPVPTYVPDQFVYPIQMAISTPALAVPGQYTLTATLGGAQNSVRLLAVQVARPDLPPTRIGVLGGNSREVQTQLEAFPQLNAEPYRENESYDLVIAAPRGNGRVVPFNNGTVISNTEDPALYNSSICGHGGQLSFHFYGLPSGPAKVSLYFCEKDVWRAGLRRFDVQINGQVVAQNLDVFEETGGQNIAMVKTYTVDAPQGSVHISVPRSSKNEAFFNAIKIEAGQKVITTMCGGENYTDKAGLLWKPYEQAGVLTDSLLQRVREGMPLLVLAGDESAADVAVRELGEAGAFKYGGTVSTARAPWMGSWVFVRAHPLYAGLPVNEVIKGDYQVPFDSCFGVLIDGPGVKIVAAYSRDHDCKIGAATFTAGLGKGSIVFQALTGMHPIMGERWLGNAIELLLAKKAPPAVEAPSITSTKVAPISK